MAARRRVNLEDWIKNALMDTDYDGPCTAISLVHVSGAGSNAVENEIKTAKIGGGRNWTPQDLANYFSDLANGFCQDIAGTQTCRLKAFYNNRNESSIFHNFLVQGQYDNNGLGTEQPTPEGRTAQHMRHTEVLTQAMMQERNEVMNASLRLVQMQSSYIDTVHRNMRELQHENMDGFRVVQEMIVKQMNESHTHNMERLKLERSFKERDKLMALAPVVVNKIAGTELIPQQIADMALFDLIAENVTTEGMQKIVATGALPPEVVAMLYSRMTDHLKKKREEEEKQKKEEEEALKRNEAETDAADDPVLLEKNPTNGSAN